MLQPRFRRAGSVARAVAGALALSASALQAQPGLSGSSGAPPAAPSAAPSAASSAAAPARTGVRAFSLDRAHSQINFIAEARFLSAPGFFEKWDADIQLDPEQFERSIVRFTIDAASINTRNERRDNHLRTADFFDVANHPTATFVSKSITKSGPNTGTITGDLTIRGVTKSVAIPVTMLFYENGRGRFKGSFMINRREYGMLYNSKVNPVEDMVEVQFNMSVLDRAPSA